MSAAAARPADVRAAGARGDARDDARAYVPGIGDPLPAGERLLWSGAPDRSAIARRLGHTRGLTIYFAVLAALGAVAARDAVGALHAVGTLVALGATAVLFVRVFAALVARSSTYAITDRRIVMRIGVAIPAVLNVPFHRVASVDLHVGRDGTGDVSVKLEGGDRIAYLLLWPHARPWELRQPQPAFRGVADAAMVGELLATAVRDDAERRPRPTVADAPAVRVVVRDDVGAAPAGAVSPRSAKAMELA